VATFLGDFLAAFGRCHVGFSKYAIVKISQVNEFNSRDLEVAWRPEGTQRGIATTGHGSLR
jgi:hypothetical protein